MTLDQIKIIPGSVVKIKDNKDYRTAFIERISCNKVGGEPHEWKIFESEDPEKWKTYRMTCGALAINQQIFVLIDVIFDDGNRKTYHEDFFQHLASILSPERFWWKYQELVNAIKNLPLI